MRLSTDERLFNVDGDGQRIATGVNCAAAQQLKLERAGRFRSCYIYLMDRPLEKRRYLWYPARIPRLPSLRVSAKERQKLTEKLLTDGTLIQETES